MELEPELHLFSFQKLKHNILYRVLIDLSCILEPDLKKTLRRMFKVS
jgi:hypothetical protein